MVDDSDVDALASSSFNEACGKLDDGDDVVNKRPIEKKEKGEKGERRKRKDYMWQLSSGKFVEEELFNLGNRLEFEHTLLDVDDELIKQHFIKAELQEIDDLHGPHVPSLSQERGKRNLATALRKNKGRLTTNKRNMGCRNDWILRSTGNGDHNEYGIGKVSKMCMKTPKALKDMLLKLIKKVNWNNTTYSKLQTIGIVHS
ncbi:1400_t:CDS:2, partial [Paraglomus brasilianum]